MANGRLISRQAGGRAELPMRRSGWRCNRPDARAGCRARCKKSTYSRRRATVSTVKKSTASMLCACVRRNSRQESPTRSPAGPDQTREAVCAQSWPRPWGAQTRSSRRRFVFVNESAEEGASPDLQRISRRCGRRIGSAAAIRGSQIKRSVRTLLVEVPEVDAEHVFELAAPEDQEPIEALSAHAADPPLGVGVRVGRLDRRPDDLDAVAADDVVEDAAELRVAVVDQEARPQAVVMKIHQP